MNGIAESDVFGVMFHHFSESEKPDALGSITASKLDAIITKLGPTRILPAQEWLDRAVRRSLPADAICLTFDDALRSQIDIALPVLERYQLTAFWFIYSSVFEGHAPGFEIYRDFYTRFFSSFDVFFDEFLAQIQMDLADVNLQAERERFLRADHLVEYGFYSDNERQYRFLRDHVLGLERFQLIMENMLAGYGLDRKQISANLWMSNDDLVMLSRNQHVVGLHSYSHPTNLASLDYVDQLAEYRRNADHIVRVTGSTPKAMAHPVNSYSTGALKILRTMGIELGFRSNPNKLAYSELEYPRKDCTHQ